MLQDITRQSKRVFVCFLTAVLCYIPIIANGLTNAMDGLWKPTDFQAGNWELAEGRWGWLIWDKMRDGYAAEPFSSLLTLLLISIGACIIINIFGEFQATYYIYAMMILISTTVCCFLSYRFMGPTYGLSVVLSSAAFRLIAQDFDDRKRRIFFDIVSVGFMAFSLGLYQLHIGIFCTLVVVYTMQLLLRDEGRKAGSLFTRSVIVAMASCIVYKIIWDIALFLRHIEASSYLGADSVSVFSMLRNLPFAVVHAYQEAIWFYENTRGNYVFNSIRDVLIFGVILGALVIGIVKLRKTPALLVPYILLFLSFPLAANFFYVLAPGADYMMDQMTGPMALMITLFFCFLEKNTTGRLVRVLPFIAAIVLYGNVYAVGTDIDALVQGNTSSRTVMNTAIDTLIKKDLYGTEYKYAFIGEMSSSPLFHKNELWDTASNYARFGEFGLDAGVEYDCYHGLLDDMGLDINLVEFEDYEKLMDSDIPESMSVYPEEGAILEKDKMVIVKLSDKWKYDENDY